MYDCKNHLNRIHLRDKQTLLSRISSSFTVWSSLHHTGATLWSRSAPGNTTRLNPEFSLAQLTRIHSSERLLAPLCRVVHRALLYDGRKQSYWLLEGLPHKPVPVCWSSQGSGGSGGRWAPGGGRGHGAGSEAESTSDSLLHVQA